MPTRFPNRVPFTGGFTEDSLLWPDMECYDPSAETEIQQLKKEIEQLEDEIIQCKNDLFVRKQGKDLSRNVVSLMKLNHAMGYLNPPPFNSLNSLGPSLEDIARLNQQQNDRENLLQRRIDELIHIIAQKERRVEELSIKVLMARQRQGICP